MHLFGYGPDDLPSDTGLMAAEVRREGEPGAAIFEYSITHHVVGGNGLIVDRERRVWRYTEPKGRPRVAWLVGRIDRVTFSSMTALTGPAFATNAGWRRSSDGCSDCGSAAILVHPADPFTVDPGVLAVGERLNGSREGERLIRWILALAWSTARNTLDSGSVSEL